MAKKNTRLTESATPKKLLRETKSKDNASCPAENVGQKVFVPPPGTTKAAAAKWLHQKIGDQIPNSTAAGLAEFVLPNVADFSTLYIKSKDARRKRQLENAKSWRDRADAIWLSEVNEISKLSGREEVARKIIEEIPFKKRPALGTVENAIKGIKQKHLKAWRKNNM